MRPKSKDVLPLKLRQTEGAAHPEARRRSRFCRSSVFPCQQRSVVRSRSACFQLAHPPPMLTSDISSVGVLVRRRHIAGLRVYGAPHLAFCAYRQDHNMANAADYARLVALGDPDFIEIKSVTFCGESKAQPLPAFTAPS